MANPFNAPEIVSSELASQLARSELVLVTDNPHDTAWIDPETYQWMTFQFLIVDIDKWSDVYATPESVRKHDAALAARAAKARAKEEKGKAELRAYFARMHELGVVTERWTSNTYDLSTAEEVLVPLRTQGGEYESEDGDTRIAMHDNLVPGLLVENAFGDAKVFVTDRRFSAYPDTHSGDVKEFVHVDPKRLVKP